MGIFSGLFGSRDEQDARPVAPKGSTDATRQRATGSKEKAYNHPLYFLLHNEPNPEMTSYIFRETLMTHLLLWGNAYAQIIRNDKGEVLALYPLMPNKMTVDRDDNGHLYYSYMTQKAETVCCNRNKDSFCKTACADRGPPQSTGIHCNSQGEKIIQTTSGAAIEFWLRRFFVLQKIISSILE